MFGYGSTRRDGAEDNVNLREKHFDSLLTAARGNPRALMAVAELMRSAGHSGRALEVCHMALAAAPDAELQRKAARFIAESVPPWQFNIVHDARRNAAYDRALRRAVRPGMRVLEIGTGTGILAMMAARAGAAEVITCEINPAVAAMAEENIRRNGFEDRVRVIAMPSTQLDAERDLGGRMDLLVTEILSMDLIAAGVVPLHRHAIAALLKPGAPIIPSSGVIRVAPAFDRGLRDETMGVVDGFDLSAFDALRSPERPQAVGSPRLELRGEAADLMTFDFARPERVVPESISVSCRCDPGMINGVAQWFELVLDDETRYENRPAPGASSAWSMVFHALPQPVEMAGEMLRIHGSHDTSRITVWAE